MIPVEVCPGSVVAVQVDEALLDRIGTGAEPGGTETALGRLLQRWRRTVDAEPIGVLVSTNTALAVIALSSARRRANPRSGQRPGL